MKTRNNLPLRLACERRHSAFARQAGQRRRRASQRRRRGFAAVYFALMLTGLLGISAMVIDIGYLYKRRADAQKACDAAALAGAYVLSTGSSIAGCTGTVDNAKYGCGTLTGAYTAARLNGFDDARSDTTVTIENPVQYNGQSNGNMLRVMIQRSEPMVFSGIFGAAFKSRTVAASSIALFTILVDIPQDAQYYGINGPVTYSQFGPNGAYGNGDPFSVTTRNGATNPEYDVDGYDYKLSVPDLNTWKSRNSNSTMLQVEVFDPDCYNAGGAVNASAGGIDELRNSSGGAGGSADATTTRYTLYWDNNTPDDTADDVQIAQTSYGYTATTDMQWVTPTGFLFDMNDSRFRINGSFAGDFRVNVKTTAGASENGYNLRAGPQHTTGSYGVSSVDATTWHNNLSGSSDATTTSGRSVNGSAIAAMGHLPMNFNIDGTADILLGWVPPTAAGGQFFVNKFDTDVGAVSVYYTCSTLPGETFSGVLSGAGTWQQDTITLPAGYAGGYWHAIYNAGAQDTSAWSLSYTQGTGRPGSIRLVN